MVVEDFGWGMEIHVVWVVRRDKRHADRSRHHRFLELVPFGHVHVAILAPWLSQPWSRSVAVVAAGR